MKLIYFANVRIPTKKAHGLQIMKMVEAFALSGLEIELIIPWRFSKTKGDPFDYYQVKRIFKIKKLPSLDLIPLSKWLSPFSFWIQAGSFSFFSLIYSLFKKPDLIYSRDLIPLFYLSFFKKNIIYEVHSLPNHLLRYKDFFIKVRKLVVVTQKIKDILVKENIPAEKILVAPDGVDLEKFDIDQSQKECRKQLNLPLEKLILGYVGQLKTMEMEKGVADMIKALKKLKKDYPDLILCLVGGLEKDIRFYKKIVVQLDLEKSIIFTGQINHSLVPYYLKSFDFCLMPFPWTKHFAYFMSPLKLFEYMAAKRPIIASDLPSIREVLSGKNAVLVEPDNIESLVEGIKNALKNREFSANLSAKAFSDVQKYTWQKRAQGIIEFINK